MLGDPVEQVQAPAMLNALFAELELDAVLVPMRVRAHDLRDVVHGLQRMTNLDGLLITVPHKVSVVGLADAASPAVDLSGSANAMRRQADGRWYADNFDGAGFIAGLHAAGHSPKGKRVTLVGAGGAGSAIAPALMEAGADTLAVCELDPAKSATMLARLDAHWPGRVTVSTTPELATAEIVVNATPLGLRQDDPLPFDPSALPDGALVADIIMKPRETALLRAAAALGHAVHYGAPMLESQVDLYRSFFRLDEAPRKGGQS